MHKAQTSLSLLFILPSLKFGTLLNEELVLVEDARQDWSSFINELTVMLAKIIYIKLIMAFELHMQFCLVKPVTFPWAKVEVNTFPYVEYLKYILRSSDFIVS